MTRIFSCLRSLSFIALCAALSSVSHVALAHDSDLPHPHSDPRIVLFCLIVFALAASVLLTVGFYVFSVRHSIARASRPTKSQRRLH